MVRYFFLPAVLWMSLSAGAQQKAVVSGTVSDSSTKGAIVRTTVVALHNRSGKLQTVLTDSLGRFLFPVADTGQYIFSATAVGYRSREQKAEVVSDMTLPPFILQQDSKVLKEVVITNEKPLIEQRADRLIYNAEKDVSTLGGTAADVMRNVPMLSVDGNGNVQMRGSSNILVLINNRPSSLVAASVADALRQIPADMVKAVEVITSPSARYDADGTAGVINIITKKNLLQGVTGNVNIVPGNVSTIGFANLSFRRKRYGLTANISTNQFYNNGTTFLQRLSYADSALLVQEGITRNRSGFFSPRIGFDYTFDAKNSISGGASIQPAHDKVSNRQVLTNKRPGGPARASNLDLLNDTRQIGYDFNLDYLRTFKDPQQEFSFLMLYSKGHSDNESNQDHYNDAKQVTYLQRNLNKSQNLEITFQADYTQPFRNKSTLEAGAKTILRDASSDVLYRNIFPIGGSENAFDNRFSYHQDVWASYLSYGFNVGKSTNVKIGARYERTTIDADFTTTGTRFGTSYHNLIPSVNAAYTFREKHTIRFGYTQRLQRPQLFFLNPYREVIAPGIVRYGNPELDPEVAHLVDLGYGTYGKDYSINVNLFGRSTNNAIASILQLVNDTTYFTFRNIARNYTAGISVSGNVKPFKRWSLNGNANVLYTDLRGDRISNSGWMHNLFVGSTLDLGKGWFHAFTGSFNSRRVTLQGRIAAFYWHNTTIRKDIWNKQGSIGINLANPFMRGTRVLNTLQTPFFEQLEDNINFTRGIRLSFTYRFGKLQPNKPPRKAKKNISNDDALRN